MCLLGISRAYVRFLKYRSLGEFMSKLNKIQHNCIAFHLLYPPPKVIFNFM